MAPHFFLLKIIIITISFPDIIMRHPARARQTFCKLCRHQRCRTLTNLCSCFFFFPFFFLFFSFLFCLLFLFLFSTLSFLALTKLVSPKPTCKVDGQTRPPRRPLRLKVCCVQCIVGVTMAITPPPYPTPPPATPSRCSGGQRLPGKKKSK